MIKNVVFDNGGVIVKYSKETYLDFFDFQKEEADTLNLLFCSREWIKLAKGEISSDDFKEYAVNRFPQYKNDVFRVLDVNNLKFMIPPHKKTIDFVKRLKQNSFNVFLLSDINEDTIKYLNSEIPNFEKLFDGIMYSCREGCVKKEGKIFDKLLKKYSLTPEECLFVDDSDENLKQAQKYKIKTYKFLDPNIDIEKIMKLLQEKNFG